MSRASQASASTGAFSAPRSPRRCVTGVTFGLVPALQSSRPDLTTALKDSGRSSTAGRSTQWLRNALVVCELAFAVVLLVGAGLFVGSFVRVMRIDTGFDYHRVLVLNVGVRVAPGPVRGSHEARQHLR